MPMLRTLAASLRARCLTGAAACALLLLGGCDFGSDDGPAEGAAGRAEARSALVELPVGRNLTPTGRFLDLAVNGEGMFVLADERSGKSVYARYGRFDLAPSGAIIDSEGRRLMGRAAADAAQATDAAAPLPLVPMLMPPKATTLLRMELNLDSRVGSPWSPVFDPTSPDSYNNATSFSVFDAKGQEVAVAVYFRKSNEADTWDAYFTANGLPLPANGSPLLSGLTFRPDGSGPMLPSQAVPVRIDAVPLSGGGSSLPVAFTLDLQGATQYGSPFAVAALAQDGYRAGRIVGMEFSMRGHISVQYDNFQTLAIGQVLLAKFTTADRFGLVGERAYSCTTSCKQPIIDVPGVMMLGYIIPGSLDLN